MAKTLILLLALGALAYWELVIAEGIHLGQPVVTWLYDLTARRYDAIKDFDPALEDLFLGLPLASALAERTGPRVLDVGAGTGRVPRTLLRQIAFDGWVVGLDPSWNMLRQAQAKTAALGDRVAWVQQVASALPFQAATFDAVTCVEVLEFTPGPRQVLRECLRVLKPGGLLLATNRRGWDARLLVDRFFSDAAFGRLLGELPLEGIRMEAWQEQYDLAWAWKTEELPPVGRSSAVAAGRQATGAR